MSDDRRPGSANLDESERSLAAAHTSPRALVIHEIVREEGELALGRTAWALTWSGLAAGLSMGFSFFTEAFLSAGLPDAPWRHLVDSFGYSVGFVLAILGQQQLFTESTLTAVLPVLARRDLATVLSCLRLWAIVLFANLVGTFIFAALLVPDGLFGEDVRAAMRDLCVEPLQGSFAVNTLRSLLAGWLIALMVWMLPSARSARLLTVVLIAYVVALGKLSHSIAGSVEAFYAVMTGAASVGDYLTKFLLPTLFGNVVGGTTLVALLNHAAVASEIEGL